MGIRHGPVLSGPAQSRDPGKLCGRFGTVGKSERTVGFAMAPSLSTDEQRGVEMVRLFGSCAVIDHECEGHRWIPPMEGDERRSTIEFGVGLILKPFAQQANPPSLKNTRLRFACVHQRLNHGI
jgi:hypothetical protein